MSPSHGTVIYGRETISFDLVYVARKTLEIAVHPDQAVVIKAPLGTDFAEVQRRVLKRAAWIRRQLNYFQQFHPKMPARRYIAGETHLYMGRQYKLKISSGNINAVKLARGYFRIVVEGSSSPGKVKSLLERWYAENAISRFNESLNRHWPYFEKTSQAKPRIRVRRMKKRWGSLSRNGVLTLNPILICAPKGCIDYVVVHELCHLRNHNHGPKFYHLLGKVMPDWELRKHKLELSLT